MKKIVALFISIAMLFAQNFYFEAFKNVREGKRILNQNPQKAEKLFIIAANDLKQLINNSINNHKPSSNEIELMGELYLNGWGVKKNERKAEKFFCIASKLGNFRAKQLIKKYGFKCHKIYLKEIKQ